MAAVTKATVQRFCEMKNEFTISELDFHEMNNLWQLYCSAKHWEGSHLQPQWNVNLVPVECPPAYPCSPLLWIRNRQPYSQLHVENLMFRYSKMWKPRNPIYITQILLSKTQMIYHCFALLWLWLFIQLRHTIFWRKRETTVGWRVREPWTVEEDSAKASTVMIIQSLSPCYNAELSEWMSPCQKLTKNPLSLWAMKRRAWDVAAMYEYQHCYNRLYRETRLPSSYKQIGTSLLSCVSCVLEDSMQS